MKTIIEMMGIIITLPFIVLEAIIKGILFISYFPTILIIAVIYPLIKKYNLNWLKNWWKYATKWKRGFHSGGIYELWVVK